MPSRRTRSRPEPGPGLPEAGAAKVQPAPPLPWPLPVDATTLGRRLVRWQAQSGRHDLPWQGSQDPYRVWLSEVMLQQTQVATVRDYYARFLAQWPSVQALAAAPLDAVLAAWSGLGYYSRARNLHRAAQALAERGAWPRSAAEWAELPGVGRSTAAAITSICFGEAVPILDGNVRRVLARLLALEGDLQTPAAQRLMWQQAAALVPPEAAGAYTQAIMDLGATCCTPRAPRCTACPWADACQARALGRPEDFPAPRKRSARQSVHTAVLWLQSGDQSWLQPRPARGIWAGLWAWPEFESVAEAEDWLQTQGLDGAERLSPLLHRLTHRDWTLDPVVARVPARLKARLTAALRERAGGSEGAWLDPAAQQRVGLPAPLQLWLAGPQA